MWWVNLPPLSEECLGFLYSIAAGSASAAAAAVPVSTGRVGTAVVVRRSEEPRASASYDSTSSPARRSRWLWMPWLCCEAPVTATAVQACGGSRDCDCSAGATTEPPPTPRPPRTARLAVGAPFAPLPKHFLVERRLPDAR